MELILRLLEFLHGMKRKLYVSCVGYPSLNGVAERLLFHHLVININFPEINSPSFDAQLRALGGTSSTAPVHAKALTIRIDDRDLYESTYFSMASDMGRLALAIGSLHNVNSAL